MNKCLWVLPVLVFLISAGEVRAQKSIPIGDKRHYMFMSVDSLTHLLSKAKKDDTDKARILLAISFQYNEKDADSVIKYAQSALDLSLKLEWEKGQSIGYNLLGNGYFRRYDFSKTLSCYRKCLAIGEKTGNKEMIAVMANNMAAIYEARNDADKALELFTKALVAYTDMGNKWDLAKVNYNIGKLYHQKKNLGKAYEYYNAARQLLEDPGNKIVLNKDTTYFDIINNKQVAEYYSKDRKLTEAAIYSGLGTLLLMQNNNPVAIEYLFKALTAFEELNMKSQVLIILNDLGTIYQRTGDFENAALYFTKALRLAEALDDEPTQSEILVNSGIILSGKGNYKEALAYFLKAIDILEKGVNTRKTAQVANNISDAYRALKDYPNALEYCFKALKHAKDISDEEDIGGASLSIGSAYLDMATDTTIIFSHANEVVISKFAPKTHAILPPGRAARLHIADEYLQQALRLARKNRFNDAVRESYKELSRLYQLMGDPARALEYYQSFTALKDSLYSRENDQKIMQQQFKYDYGKKEDSLKLENEKKELALQKELELKAVRYEYEKKQAAAKSEKEKQQLKYEQQLKEQQIEYEYAQKIAKTEAEQKQKEAERKQREAIAKLQQEKKDALTNEQLIRERNIRYASVAGIVALAVFSFFIFKARKRSDMLLLNILPSSVAKELKKKGSSEAKLFDEVTVLFTDFVSFTKVSERLTPQELVNELHACFKEFDRITAANGIEKIKTVGDAYLAVCGLPKANPDHAVNVVKAAKEIKEFMIRRKEQLGDRTFGIRLGIHSGNVVAGIVGIKKFAYDIWGDTVNTAARMEQNSEAGKINISEATYELVKDQYACIYRGEIEAKNKGALKMYFVE